MDSENLKYKIDKYTTKLKNAKSDDRAAYYQRKLREYHQINQYGGFIDSPVSSISDIRNIKVQLDHAIESCKDDPDLFSELSKVISSSNNKIRNISGGNKAPPSENLLNTVQQFFERSDNIKDLSQGCASEEGHIMNLNGSNASNASNDIADRWKSIINSE
jgi:hypothetical protein